MKLPLKYIAILVILSLAGIFSYQAYWLGGLYRTMRNDLERNIIEAMRMSDYNEMMIRVDNLRTDSIDHGEVSVSAGFEKDDKASPRTVQRTPMSILLWLAQTSMYPATTMATSTESGAV